MRKHNKITSRKDHYSKQTIRNLISASNCLSGVRNVTWDLRANKKARRIAGPKELFKKRNINNYGKLYHY